MGQDSLFDYLSRDCGLPGQAVFALSGDAKKLNEINALMMTPNESMKRTLDCNRLSLPLNPAAVKCRLSWC
jgi:hypothetical protein